MASAALLAAGCSTENKAEGTEYGTLKVSCTADGSIDAASDDTSRMPAAPSVPQAGDFTLTVTGESGTQKWDTLAEFEQSETVFRMGAYTVSVAHGDPDAEGIDKPYYAAEKSVEVLPRRAATVEMTATIANSQTVVRATEQFLNYFHDAQVYRNDGIGQPVRLHARQHARRRAGIRQKRHDAQGNRHGTPPEPDRNRRGA